MFTFLIPLYYLVSKLAEEKELRSREGMKMMGLKDSSYFLSWFVFYFLIIIVMFFNIIFGIIIDTFASLRDQKAQMDDDMRNICFICSIDR